MRVRELMTRDVAICSPEATANDAVRLMWDRNCGFMPLVEPTGRKLRGVITDRDICIAAFTRGMPLTEIRAGDVMARQPLACRDDDDVAVAHDLMRAHQIRRLPVTDHRGALVGVVSIDDLALAALQGDREADLHETAVTLGAICKRNPMACR